MTLPPLPSRCLVVVAGLPGAGKTTLVRRWAAAPGVVALDAEDVAAGLAALPYRVVRPLVHALHLLRLLAVLATPADRVLTSDPLTSDRRRRWFRFVAAVTGRRLVVVLVHVSPWDARDGQRRRGRVLSESRTARHEQRYRQDDALLDLADHVLTREQAAVARLGPVRTGAMG